MVTRIHIIFISTKTNHIKLEKEGEGFDHLLSSRLVIQKCPSKALFLYIEPSRCLEFSMIVIENMSTAEWLTTSPLIPPLFSARYISSVTAQWSPWAVLYKDALAWGGKHLLRNGLPHLFSPFPPMLVVVDPYENREARCRFRHEWSISLIGVYRGGREATAQGEGRSERPGVGLGWERPQRQGLRGATALDPPRWSTWIGWGFWLGCGNRSRIKS